MKNLLIRTGTGIVLVIVVVGAILLGKWTFLALVSLIFLGGSTELKSIFPVPSFLFFILLLLSGFTLILSIFLRLDRDMDLWIFFIPVSLFLTAQLSIFPPAGKRSGNALSFSMYTFFWLALPLGLFLFPGWVYPDAGFRHTLVLSIMILIWIHDTFAYLSGTLAGTHKIAPVLSPGKSWEGFIGGTVFATGGALVIHRITGIYTLPVWILLGLIISVSGLAGDLFESRLKRIRGIKNTGSLLPGHGGILDRFDSLLFVAPACFLTLILIQWL